VVAARASHVVAYDNLSSLPQWLSDGLSTIATGGGYEARQLFTDLDEVLVTLKRPILLNGIENPAVSADLLDRSLVAGMTQIKDEKRRSEDEIDADVVALGGELVGAVFSAVSGALAGLGSTPRPTWARMVDATHWALAASPALGTTAQGMETTLKLNRTRRDELVLEASVFALAVFEFARAKRVWHGTPVELWRAVEIDTEVGKANSRKKEVWPQTIQMATAILAREAPILRRRGVEWKDGGRRGGIRIKMLTYTKPEGTADD
jgi:hypothetical protein